MKEVRQYRQFAQECLRLAASAKQKDKAVLFEIAEAWEEQARLAEEKIAKPDGKGDGQGPVL
jgi:hypothetical protein